MTKYITCIKCDIEQPVTNYIVMKSGEIKRTCKSCKNGHKTIIKKLRKENEYPSDDYCCPICDRDLEELSKYGQIRMKTWVLDHCHETNTFRGWICHHCNTGLGAFSDETTRLANAMRYLDTHRAKLEKAENLYSKKDLPELKEDLKDAEKDAKQRDLDCYHKDYYSNSYEREAKRLRKLIKFIEAGLEVQEYESGTVLINDKFVVTLRNDNWRILHKSTWYRHKSDLQHFIDNYILKEYKK